ncbi:MAG: HAD family hydrolase [Campylobacteraceae bacterium]|nr:HAD family hydrolase [Campylobacteraceae bacterium]
MFILKVKVIVFDLDDTLYDEIGFVKSGFQAVSEHFLPNDPNLMLDKMLETLKQHGRGKVFDKTFEHFGLYSKQKIKKALSIYRTHLPKIKLNDDAKKILEYYKKQNTPLYIVTDGNKIVQANKIKALNLDKWIKKAFITHRYGLAHAKPSPYCFIKIAKEEKVDYTDIAYIADNANKDFVNIKKLGFRTVRIKQGMFQDALKPKEFHAEQEIDSLCELKDMLKGKD